MPGRFLSPFMPLFLFGCSGASANECSVSAGLGYSKVKNQHYFRYNLPATHHQTRISSLCEPNTRTPTALKKNKSSSVPFFLGKSEKASLETWPETQQRGRAAVTRYGLPQRRRRSVLSLMPRWVCWCICASEIKDRNNYLLTDR